MLDTTVEIPRPETPVEHVISYAEARGFVSPSDIRGEALSENVSQDDQSVQAYYDKSDMLDCLIGLIEEFMASNCFHLAREILYGDGFSDLTNYLSNCEFKYMYLDVNNMVCLMANDLHNHYERLIDEAEEDNQDVENVEQTSYDEHVELVQRIRPKMEYINPSNMEALAHIRHTSESPTEWACMICLDNDPTDLLITDCQHTFHQDCFIQNLKHTSSTCRICRMDLSR
jgi:hypothetical protein